MDTVYFSTGNKDKLLISQIICSKFNIKVEQVVAKIDEIQGEKSVFIAQDKARRAYESSSKPIVISDDSWEITALNGFPGPYMKSINKWFKPQDFIRLMSDIEDRRIILHQFLVFYDGNIMKTFKNKIHGKITDKPRGKNIQSPVMTVIELEYDNGMTMAEVFELGKKVVAKRYLAHRDVWHKFSKWYYNQNKISVK